MENLGIINMNDIDFLEDYFNKLFNALALKNYRTNLIDARNLILEVNKNNGRIIIIGNGGSAAIASHMSIDLSKNAHINSFCFNDASMITCLANDYGHDNWMANALRIYSTPSDCLLAISSSGRSMNIINAVNFAKGKGMPVITFSGMNPDNELKKLGSINFWVDSFAYNIIESAHQFLISSVIDLIIGKAEYSSN